MKCQNCGNPLPEDARFCPNCGAPVVTDVATDERKIVTVLFADLVDSTGLANRLDPERAREVLASFYESASQELMALRGQPEKFIGDAVMAVFGLPQVQEDDAVRAIRAGLAIHERTRRMCHELGLPFELSVRVGIESGDVATGVGPQGQLLVTGAVVNAAQRLQAAAEPGETLVGATARDLTRMAVSFGPTRRVDAKGFDGTLEASPVEAISARSSRRTIPLVGRLSELSLMRDTLTRVIASGRPHLFTVVGEPGIGKTRLIDEFVAGLGEDVRALVGLPQGYEGAATFGQVASMVREHAGIRTDDPPEAAMKRLRDIVDGCSDPTEAERVAARLALALDLGMQDRRDESTFVQEVQSGFLSLVEGLAGRGPVVLTFDDLHSARPPMLDLVERLVGRARRGPGPVLVIAGARPSLLEDRTSWGSGAVNATTLRLEPLSMRDSIELTRAAGGESLREEAAASVAERAGGNPFFIVETTGMLLREGQTGPVRPGAPLPPTVTAVVAARLDHLPPALRDVARRASVFLYSFDLQELRLVAQADEDVLRGLEDEEILVDGSSPGGRWRFRHETVREVAYSSLPKRERLRLHVQVADSLVGEGHPVWAAEHLERAALASLDLNPDDRSLPDRAVSALIDAADTARRRMENFEAVDQYERALALTRPEAEWGVREARAWAGLGESKYWLSDYVGALEALSRAEALGEAHGDTWTLCLSLGLQGDIALNYAGDIDKAERLLSDALTLAEALDDSRILTRTLLFAGWIPWTREDWMSAEVQWRRALELARANGDRWAETRALTSLSIVRSEVDDNEEARELAQAALDVASEVGDQFNVAVASVQLGRLAPDLGDPEGALPYFDRALATFDELGARWEVADVLGARGSIYRDLGRLDEAEADLQASVRLSEELGARQLSGWVWRNLAAVSEKRGNRAEAEERLRRADEEEAWRSPQADSASPAST
ncbi:MAG TPA: tetratricopeptide repeat protein [Actinomycetota bacterium]